MLAIVLAGGLLTESKARADAASSWHAHVATSLGWTQGSHSGGLTIDALGLVGFHVVEAGLAADVATDLFGSSTALSLLGGLGLELDRLRLGLWAECGGVLYTGVGSNFLVEDPGVSALLPFAGARASVALRALRRSGASAVWLGITAMRDSDLHTVTHSSTYTLDDNTVATEQHQVGQDRWALLATVSVTAEL
jgi:hypothetical protein